MRPKEEPGTAAAKDPDRFYCPYPGCNRSFAELWRLKVHYRAPPDVRGSGACSATGRAATPSLHRGPLTARPPRPRAGKERGHGTELTHCPKCGKGLKPGKHHVGCSATKPSATPRASGTKRQKLVRSRGALPNCARGDVSSSGAQ